MIVSEQTLEGILWLKSWNLHGEMPNPPNKVPFPTKFPHLHSYVYYMAYIPPPRQSESARSLRHRIYNILRTLHKALYEPCKMRIETIHVYPNSPWHTVWRHLHDAWVSEDIKSVWFLTIHDILPTKERLARIQERDTNQCTHCDQPDTILHRLTQCGEVSDIWHWTRLRMALMLRMDLRHIPPEWTTQPGFHILPPHR
jgi:hypothetical protein